MEHQDNPPILDLSDKPLPITEGTIVLELHKVGKTTYGIPDDATPEQRHFFKLLNGDAGDWDALIDAKIKDGMDEKAAFLEVVQADPVLKAAWDAAYPNGIEDIETE